MNFHGHNLPQRIHHLAAVSDPQQMAEAWPSIDSQQAREFVFWKCAERGYVGCLEVICAASNAAQMSELLHCTGYSGRTALAAACAQGLPRTVALLLQQGASCDEVLLARDSRGWMAIHHAARVASVECVQQLLAGASTRAIGGMVTDTVCGGECMCTALELGVRVRCWHTVREFLLLGHDPQTLGRALRLALESPYWREPHFMNEPEARMAWGLLQAGADVKQVVQGPEVLHGGAKSEVVTHRWRRVLAFLGERAVTWDVQEAALQESRARLGLEVNL
jgi:ankyrin repeat protein